MGRGEKFKPLKFGTSGLRDEVANMTDMECYINTMGFIAFLSEKGQTEKGRKIALGGDRRGSTPRIMSAVSKAIEDSGSVTVLCGKVPTPTLANYAIREGIPSIMVTGSHIPEDRNGIKFTKTSGEVLKSDEQDILKNVACARKKEYGNSPEESLFNDNGMFKENRRLPEAEYENEAIELYIKRYLDVFPADAFKGKKIVLYQHSAVGRDIMRKIFEDLGAEIIDVGRSEKFVPVDTEKVSEETMELLKQAAEEHTPFAIISTDGDSDRPLLADEKGEFLPGDKLGALVSMYLKPDFAAVPISANDAVVSALEKKGIRVKQTKIGSPYVIKAMNDELEKDPAAKVVSWESNGGFLTGSDWDINGHILKALPTRDAILPLIAAQLLAIDEGMSLSELIAAKLPARYTCANVIDDKTPGCENYTADTGKIIIKMFSPDEEDITQVDFNETGQIVHYQDGREKKADSDLTVELGAIWDRLTRYFNAETGFEKIVSVNFIDGIRMTFANGDVSHIRPSGNAPEFRNYATADTLKRAEEIVEKRKEIVPRMVADMSMGKIASAVVAGSPVYVLPYEEPKVWGVDGIGEYWYGAESGSKSSTGMVGADAAPMDEIIKYDTDEFLGRDVVKKFGDRLPLVKILTPKSRLSIQFHDTKNELWIVTGIDNAVSKGEPSIILGFSRKSVELYGRNVTEHYHEVLEKYGTALNALIDLLEERGYKDLLEKTGDVVKVAERAVKEKPHFKEALNWLNNIRAELEQYYNYRTVSIGDVIPVPAGTLHALGPGVEVVEPQIAGATQSLEDGPTYPVRYAFPDYQRETARKVLDIDRVGEMHPEVVKGSAPEVISGGKGSPVIVERLPGGFESKGLEVHRITLEAGAELEETALTSFHNLVVVEGKARIATGGKNYDIPEAAPGGEMLIVPASAGNYKIMADERTRIIDTFTPVS